MVGGREEGKAGGQEGERKVLGAIIERLDNDPALCATYCTVVEGEGWHRGVVGIAASRVVERYGRPALVISTENGEAHGSGRSIRGFHLLDAVETCCDLFTKYGGHAHAFGLSLPSNPVADLRQRLHSYAPERRPQAHFPPTL